MGAIAGVIRLSPSAVDSGYDVPTRVETILEARLRATSAIEPEVAIAGPVTMMAVPLAGESATGISRRKYRGEPEVLLAWDGHLHNRRDLLCRTRSDCTIASSDATLACAHLARRGPDGFGDLLGEWSGALLLETADGVFLASDYFGIGPLYYRQLRHVVAWASSIEILLGLEDDDLDLDYLLGCITFCYPACATPYHAIKAVPPGHYLHIRRDGATILREYWNFAYTSVSRATPEAYADELRTLLSDAVQVRLSSRTPVWALLSGGYDSSALYGLADRLIATGAVAVPSLRAAFYFSRSSPESNESRFVDVVTEGTPWLVHRLDHDEYPTIRYSLTTPLPLPGTAYEVAKRMAAEGSTILLSGELGDVVMGNFLDHSYSLATHIQRGAALAFLNDTRRWALANRQTTWSVIAKAITMLLPVSWQRHQRLAEMMRGEDKWLSLTPASLATFFAVPRHLGERVRASLPDTQALASHWPDAGRRYMLWGIYYPRNWRLYESPEALPAIRYSYPFTHRPLVEFVLGVPHAVLCRPGEPRAAMKAALAELLPQRTLQRFSKGHAEPTLFRLHRERVGRLIEKTRSLRLVELGLVDHDVLVVQVQRFLAGATASGRHLRYIAMVEDWLNFLDTSSASTLRRTSQSSQGDGIHKRKEVEDHDVRCA